MVDGVVNDARNLIDDLNSETSDSVSIVDSLP